MEVSVVVLFLFIILQTCTGSSSNVRLPPSFTLTYEGRKSVTGRTPRGASITSFTGVWMRDEERGVMLRHTIYRPITWFPRRTLTASKYDWYEPYVPKDEKSFFEVKRFSSKFLATKTQPSSASFWYCCNILKALNSLCCNTLCIQRSWK